MKIPPPPPRSKKTKNCSAVQPVDRLIDAQQRVFQLDLIKLGDCESALWWSLTPASATRGGGGGAQPPGRVRCPSLWLADKCLSVGMSPGIQEEDRKKQNRRQFQYFICEREEGEEAPRRPRHLHPDGVGPRGRVRDGSRTATANYWKIPLFLHYAYCVCGRLRPSQADTSGSGHSWAPARPSDWPSLRQ